MKNNKKRRKNGIAGKAGAVILLGISVLFLYACAGRQGETDMAQAGLNTPEEAVQVTMEKLKELDMKAFNACTDNLVSTHRNWMGFPTEKEYRVFNELMNTGWKNGTRYEKDYKLAEKSVARMTWKIKDVREEDDQAEVDMEITNIDMMKVLGNYEIYEMECLAGGGEFGVGQFVKGMFNLANIKEDLTVFMDALDEEDMCTISVTVRTYKQDGQWKVHLSQEFIDAFLGYRDLEKYPEEVGQKIDELTDMIEEGAETWAEE
ncbi:MAG: hypothetical protein K2G19_10815 [Lachnospiraceae bacterium]|nr:hypothetical protein [Lachnospiraceae bacterium]